MIEYPGRPLRAFTGVLAVLGLLAGSAASAGRAATARLATHSITINGLQYQPATLTIAVGDRIAWRNQDPFPHTVTSTSGRFDSHEIPAGGTWVYRARRAGVFAYHCSLHPTMKAELRVISTPAR